MTKEEATMQVAAVVGKLVRDLCVINPDGVPSGHLYAQVMGALTLDQYQFIVNVLKRAGLVKERNHLLTWTGPAKEKI